jgi:tetratricopeptide (TPR) repeat protein
MTMTSLISRMTVLGLIVLLLGSTGCFQKRKPLVPLALDGEAKAQALTLTEQGTQAYQARQYEEAKRYFGQAVTEAPQSGQAHYNYALALNALGDAAVARQHFLEAADLAPEDKVIWDSPALSPYGNLESKNKNKFTSKPPRSSFGSGLPGGGY